MSTHSEDDDSEHRGAPNNSTSFIFNVHDTIILTLSNCYFKLFLTTGKKNIFQEYQPACLRKKLPEQ